MKTYYLAHPVSPDDKYTYEQNIAHALKVARICWDAGFRVDMPWWTVCHFLQDSNPEHRDSGMEFTSHMVTKHDGVILIGHKISKGMKDEIRVADMHEVMVYNLVGVPDLFLDYELRLLINGQEALA